MRPAISLRGTWTARHSPIAAACALSIALPCTAQTPSTAAPTQEAQLETVTVRATRIESRLQETPASVDVVDAQRIRSSGAMVNVTEALQVVPGLLANNRNNYAQDVQLSSRGFGARTAFGLRGIRLYVDGIPGNSPDGQGQISHADLGSAQRIEVLRGPFSALYGNSSGGVILIDTESGQQQGEWTSGLMLGADGQWRLSQKLSGTLGGGEAPGTGLRYVVSASGFHTDGWREHSEADKRQFNAKLQWSFARATQATLLFNHVNMPDADDPQGLTRNALAQPRSVVPSALTFDTRKDTKQSQLGFKLDHALSPDHKLSAMLYAGQRDIQQFLSVTLGAQNPPTSSGGVVDLDRQSHGLELRYSGRKALEHGFWEWELGAALDRLNEQRRGFENFIASSSINPDPLCISGASRLFVCGVQGRLRRDERNRLQSDSVYAQTKWWFGENSALQLGWRSNRVKLSSSDRYIVNGNPDDSGAVRFQGNTPVLAVIHNLQPKTSVYLSWGKGFDSPTMNEIAYNPNSAASGLNLTLKPSRGRQLELGLKHSTGAQGRLSAAIFQANTDDEIVVLSNAGGRSRFQNAGRTTRKGFELSLDQGLGAQWRAQLAYTWLDARYRDSFTSCYLTTCTPGSTVPANQPQLVASGNRLPGTAKQQLYGELAWRGRPASLTSWPGQMEAALEFRATGRIMVNDLNTEAAAGYGLLALRLGARQQVGRWTFAQSLRIDNLANRNYVGSVIVNQANQQFYEPGLPRQWQLGLTAAYKF